MGDAAPNPTMRGRRGRAAWSTLVYVICGLYAAILSVGLLVPGVPADKRVPVLILGIAAGNVLTLIFGIVAATRRALLPATRRAWKLLCIGFLFLNLMPVGYAISGQEIGMPNGDASWGDVFHLMFVPAAVAGLLTFPRANGSRRARYKIGLDMGTILAATFILLWYFTIGPLLTRHDLSMLNLTVAMAYPLGDMILLFAALTVVLHGVNPVARRPLALLTACLVFMTLNDAYLGYIKSHYTGGPVTADRLQYGCVVVGVMLQLLAVVEQCRQATATEQAVSGRQELRRPSSLPYVALGAGNGLLLIIALRYPAYPWLGLVIGAAAMSAFVTGRQVLASRENHELLVRDYLTGLANRLHMQETLDNSVRRAARTGAPAAVMLLDMDGFKEVNDTLGHEGGDQLLAGFAKLLKASVLGSDLVARIGGDEFVIVFGNIGTAQNADIIANRIIEAMEQPIAIAGQQIQPRASIGIAVMTGSDELTSAELLHRADLAMYQAKTRKHLGSSWERHTDEDRLQPAADVTR